MSLTHTPHANRLHIALLGRCNSGKSSLINALTGQDTALVSDTPGTTTDPVTKAMELPGIGPCLFIDTPGFDDNGPLGTLRVERTLKALERTDIALLLCQPDMKEEMHWMQLLKEKKIPAILLLNKADWYEEQAAASADTTSRIATAVEQQSGQRPLIVSAHSGQGIEHIRRALLERMPEEFDTQTLTGGRVAEGDLVLLVMPQDMQAPKGRLILPQVQTLRELLDKRCLVMSCTPDKLAETLQALTRPPRLIITDSQVFRTVYEQKPKESALTSFSVLFAEQKGDIGYYTASATAIDRLTPSSRVLIAEACTHAPQSEDIGRVKIPLLLRKKVGQGLQIEVASGADFPEDVTPYDLIIQCGACMFNRKYVLSRIEQARRQGVPMTNYGVAIAHLHGILDKIDI